MNQCILLSPSSQRILELLQSTRTSLQEIVSLIKGDSGLTLRILEIANSNYYAIPGGVYDLPKAMQHIGMGTLEAILLTHFLAAEVAAEGNT